MKSLFTIMSWGFLFLFGSVALAETFESKLVDASIERTTKSVRYDGSYISIPYPNGDVPSDIGVCTDVIIRSYRKLGIDLQKLVHEDMSATLTATPLTVFGG